MYARCTPEVVTPVMMYVCVKKEAKTERERFRFGCCHLFFFGRLTNRRVRASKKSQSTCCPLSLSRARRRVDLG